MSLVEATGLVKAYDQGRIRALDGVDLTIERGEFVSVIGPSGSGKSTLLHVVGALETPDAGTVIFDGIDLGHEKRLDRVRARSLGFVFQLHHLIPTLTALENVEIPLRALHLPRAERRRRAAAMLDAVALSARSSHLPNALSGGERQRVAIARALVNEPSLVLADEPTGSLDQDAGTRILELLETVREQQRRSLLLVTHEPAIAARADRTLRLVDGRVAAETN